MAIPSLVVGALIAGLIVVSGPAAAASTPVMRSSLVTASDLAGWYRTTGKVNGATEGIDALASYYIDEGADEGVAGDLAFAQSIVETGYFGFSTRVPGSFNNFSGLGAVDGGSSAAQFPNARTGVRAQIQHLRAYADPSVTSAKLANALVDPRFDLVAPKGKAPTWEQFGNGIWATDPTYASKVLSIYQQILSYAGATGTTTTTSPTTTTTPTTTTLPSTTWAPFASADALVAQAHRDLLAREATDAERAFGASVLTGGVLTPGAYLASLVAGEGAAHAQPVARLYLAALGRLPDPSGMGYWTRRHAAGWPLTQIVDQILGSNEFERRFGGTTDHDFVDQLYRNILDRDGDPSGVDYWTRRLTGGQIGRTGLVVQFSESSEHLRTSQVQTEASVVYLGMLRRAPDPSVLSWWATKKASGSGLDVLTSLVLGSSAYQARFS
ncbi:MAG: DUF4214 domain-containing protein [Acidimicrobiales bacterium]